MSADKIVENQIDSSMWRMSVAPMMDWTDKHCRYLHRLLSQHALLYTEMVTTGALLHGDVPRHLRFEAEEHPLALQLGGSEPADLAQCARLGQQWGYDEINLNCGCPSERVQRGAFGACLMKEAPLVADCIKAMRDVVDIPVTVKHRIGIDRNESYEFVRDFVGQVADAGCEVFIVHARNAWLKGLSPKENRDIPPLRYEIVSQLKQDFPSLTMVVNGGIKSDTLVQELLGNLDGVMIGREAYHNPWWLASWDALYYGREQQEITRERIEEQMVVYMEREASTHGTHWYSIARHMLGLRNGLAGARRWRQVWSDHKLKELPPARVMEIARTKPQL
ncbi:tRNA dihydrouridine(20/20a) synthase DusA [Comamonas composti]|uniref:tRNA dihydrouridine(20/20a) synthase DusA n=1 Tax=Comamonas composti TaxID=408558 RepID=UPI000A0429E7|nr:tRNA dihydrouridine(20/20a) synthase DusA [Comamonas composti]